MSTVLRLAKRFPQLILNSSTSLDHLKEEFTDFLLSQVDVEAPTTYKACEPDFTDHHHAEYVVRPCATSFWWKVGHMKSLDGEPCFSTLFKPFSGLLSIPCANADANAVLTKIHTDQLDHTTIVSLMYLKFNCDECCFDVKLYEELLSKCKRGTLHLPQIKLSLYILFMII